MTCLFSPCPVGSRVPESVLVCCPAATARPQARILLLMADGDGLCVQGPHAGPTRSGTHARWSKLPPRARGSSSCCSRRGTSPKRECNLRDNLNGHGVTDGIAALLPPRDMAGPTLQGFFEAAKAGARLASPRDYRCLGGHLGSCRTRSTLERRHPGASEGLE